MVTHPLGVVLLVQMRALQDLRGPSLHLLLILRFNVHINLWRVCCLSSINMHPFAQYSVNFVYLIGITSCFQFDINLLAWALMLVRIFLFVTSCGNDFNFIRHAMIELWNWMFVFGIKHLEIGHIIKGTIRGWIIRLRFTLHDIEIWIRVSCLLLMLFRIQAFVRYVEKFIVIGDKNFRRPCNNLIWKDPYIWYPFNSPMSLIRLC